MLISPDDADPMIELDDLNTVPAAPTTDADAYRVARGLASSLSGAVGDWTLEHQR